MNFAFLNYFHKKWQDILVIGKTIERNKEKYHILGMTLSDEAKLYIIESHQKIRNKGIRNQRRLLKEQEETESLYLHCSDFYLGNEKLCVQGGISRPLQYSSENYEIIQLFFDMMSAGWIIPEWLEFQDWNCLQLTTLTISNLTIANFKKLPKYLPETPITINHQPFFLKHILEKTITLAVGKSRSFCFIDNYGENVQCYINNITLIDMWKNTEEIFNHPKFTEKFSPEQLQQEKIHSYKVLEQHCPKGMCYIGIEYECSKDITLTFYSKQYLKSRPKEHQGNASSMLVYLKHDKKIGTHHLPLKSCVMQTPVPPDVSKIPAELFFYSEKIGALVETIL